MEEYENYDNTMSDFSEYPINELENLVKSGEIKVISGLNHDLDNLSVIEDLDTFKLDNTLFLNLKKSKFNNEQKAIFDGAGIYASHETSSEYGGIDTWWVGYDREDAYETHVYGYNGGLLITMTNHNDFESQFKVFYGFDDFIKYLIN